MPLYTYKCKKCGHVTEKLQTSYDAQKTIKCEECGQHGAKRQLHATAFKMNM